MTALKIRKDFRYIDLLDNKNYELTGYFDEKMLLVMSDKEIREYGEKEIKQFQVCGSGTKSGNGRRVMLPAEWYDKEDKHFIFEVKGDSMTKAGIERGDLVLVKDQREALRHDIVAVKLEGNTALKRYLPVGNRIVLKSENPAYRMVKLMPEEVDIIGVAIGVIKGEV